MARRERADSTSGSFTLISWGWDDSFCFANVRMHYAFGCEGFSPWKFVKGFKLVATFRWMSLFSFGVQGFHPWTTAFRDRNIFMKKSVKGNDSTFSSFLFFSKWKCTVIESSHDSAWCTWLELISRSGWMSWYRRPNTRSLRFMTQKIIRWRYHID